MSQAERQQRQNELAARQAAEYLEWRRVFSVSPITAAVHRAFMDTYPPLRTHAAHWVIGVVNRASWSRP